MLLYVKTCLTGGKNMRVYEFARKYDMTSKAVVALCAGLGFEVKAQSKLNDEVLDLLDERFGRGKDTDVQEVMKSMVKRPRTKKTVVYVATECEPFTSVGELGKTVSANVAELVEQGTPVMVVLPKYQVVDANYKETIEWMMDLPVKVGEHEVRASIFKLVKESVTYLFVGNDHFFNREEIYGQGDDAERFSFFSRAILDVLPLIGVQISEIIVNEWHTSILPLLLKVDYSDQAFYSKVKITLMIHNLEYQGWYQSTVLKNALGISQAYYENGLTRMGDSVNLLKSGIETAHKVVLTEMSAEQMKLDDMINSGMSGILEAKLAM